MKKYVYLLTVMMVGLCGCGSGDSDECYTGKVVRVGTEQVCVGVSKIPEESLQSSPLLNNVISFEKTDLPIPEYYVDMQIRFLVVSYEPISHDGIGNYDPKNPQFFCIVKPVK